MPQDQAPSTVDALLRTAAAGDARTARAVLAGVDGVRLLELLVTQAELAVDEDRPRPAGVDAIGDLARAAVEVMGLPQAAGGNPDEDETGPPTVTGWELATVLPTDLPAAVLTVAVPTWALAVVAFIDHRDHDGSHRRQVVGAAADGRLVGADLRLDRSDDGDGTFVAELLRAHLTRDPADLGADQPLAAGLLASLRAPAGG